MCWASVVCREQLRKEDGRVFEAPLRSVNREAWLCEELLAAEIMLIGLELDEGLRSGPPP